MTTVRIEQRQPSPIAVIRRTVTAAQRSAAVREGCGAAWNAVRAQGGRGGHNIGVYLDGARIEAGVVLQGPFTDTADVVTSATPAGRVATAMHVGPYQTLGETHSAIRSWCATHGHTLAGPNWEIYGHWIEEWNRDPSKITTEVCYLLAG